VDREDINWFKRHVDTVVVLAGVIGSVLWMNHHFNESDKNIASLKSDVQKSISEVEKSIALLKSDVAVIKAILVVKDVFPKELAYTVHSNKIKAEEVKE
jgi:uncharacterized protein Yka (UPF0111/DUF47 family)